MKTDWRRWLLVACAGIGLTTSVGCAQREHKKVRVVEEQKEGEVREEPQGEMVVE